MEQELEILRDELHKVEAMAKLQATTFPTFKTPINFRMADLPFVDLPNEQEQN